MSALSTTPSLLRSRRSNWRSPAASTSSRPMAPPLASTPSMRSQRPGPCEPRPDSASTLRPRIMGGRSLSSNFPSLLRSSSAKRRPSSALNASRDSLPSAPAPIRRSMRSPTFASRPPWRRCDMRSASAASISTVSRILSPFLSSRANRSRVRASNSSFVIARPKRPRMSWASPPSPRMMEPSRQPPWR